MGENDLMNARGQRSVFTVKNIVRVFAILCVIFVFCPSFLVSCSGEEVGVNIMTAVGGVSAYGEKVVDPHPIMLICLLIPVVVLVLTFLKKFADRKTAGIILACTAGNLIIWLIFRASVKRVAEENYCSFETTGWYVINIIVMVLTILLSLLVVLGKMGMDMDLIVVVTGGGKQATLDQMSAAVNQMSGAVTQLAGNVASNIASNMHNRGPKENVIGYCAKCGSPIEYGCKFCISCGTPVPESMIAEAEAAKRAEEEKARAEEEARMRAAEEARRRAEEARREEERKAAEAAMAVQTPQADSADRPMFCQKCGTKIEADAVFCKVCGNRIVQ